MELVVAVLAVFVVEQAGVVRNSSLAVPLAIRSRGGVMPWEHSSSKTTDYQ